MRKMFALSCGLLVAGCGPNLYSLPVFTSVQLHNRPAMEFLKAGGPHDLGSPGPGLSPKDPYADGALVALSVSGGGMRASAFTLGVLAELDEPQQGRESAFEEIDLISSISGGSWAVAAVLADRADGSTAPLAQRMRDIEARYAALSEVKVAQWADSFIPDVTLNKTFAQVYPSSAAKPLPFAYFNATLFPSQSPFVFTPAYLAHYRVSSLGDPAAPQRVLLNTPDLATIPIGYAASASGAVPGYTSAFAGTSLCTPALSSYCFANRKGGVRNSLQLMDGGLYDNIGYKTALEIGLRDRARNAQVPATIIMIDTADAEDFQTMPASGRDGAHVLDIAMASSFPNQNATFDRLRKLAFPAAGFDRQILLDFAATAGFDRAQHGRHLHDLPDLAYFAAHDVSCYADNGDIDEGNRVLRDPGDPGSVESNLDTLAARGSDCLALNFARTGYLHKTTFKYEEYAFVLRYQLGRLAVRMKRDAIDEAVYRARREPAQ